MMIDDHTTRFEGQLNTGCSACRSDERPVVFA
jgi:hypothetical protein